MEKKNSLVSIIIATKNGQKYIKRAIESALNQTYKNIELIIIDGGSTDNTKEVVKPYLTDQRVYYIYKTDKNASEGLNNGIRASNGKYIAILDDDDFWCDEKKLEKQVQFLEGHPDYVLVSGGAIAIDKEGRECYRLLPPETDEEIKKLMLFDCVFPHGATIFRKEAWKVVGGYDEKINLSWDWELWLRLGGVGRFYNFQDYFLCYSQESQNKRKHLRRQSMEVNLELRKKYRNEYPNFWKAYLLGLGCYFCSFFPRQRWFTSMLIIPKIKNIFFHRQIYKKGE